LIDDELRDFNVAYNAKKGVNAMIMNLKRLMVFLWIAQYKRKQP